MATKHMKKRSPPLIIREHKSNSSGASPRTSQNGQLQKVCKLNPGKKGTLLHCWWECKLLHPLWRTVWRLLKILKTELPYDPEPPLLGIDLEKTIVLKDTCDPVFPAALFTMAQDMEATCMSIGSGVEKEDAVHTLWNTTQPRRGWTNNPAVKSVGPEKVILSEVHQTKTPLVCGL